MDMRYLIGIVLALAVATYADAQNKNQQNNKKTQYTSEEQRFIDQVKYGITQDLDKTNEAALKTSRNWTDYFYDIGEMAYYNPGNWDEAYPETRKNFNQMTPKQKTAVIRRGMEEVKVAKKQRNETFNQKLKAAIGISYKKPADSHVEQLPTEKLVTNLSNQYQKKHQGALPPPEAIKAVEQAHQEAKADPMTQRRQQQLDALCKLCPERCKQAQQEAGVQAPTDSTQVQL